MEPDPSDAHITLTRKRRQLRVHWATLLALRPSRRRDGRANAPLIFQPLSAKIVASRWANAYRQNDE